MAHLTPAPGTPQTPYKAYVATAVAFVGTFIAFWIADTDPFTAKEIGAGILLAAANSGITGGVTYGVANRAK